MYNERLPVFCFCNTVYLAVCELKSPSMSDFLWGLENSGWLRHIKAIMDAGILIEKVCDCIEQSMRFPDSSISTTWECVKNAHASGPNAELPSWKSWWAVGEHARCA